MRARDWFEVVESQRVLLRSRGENGPRSELGFSGVLQLNEPKELIDWTHNASKAAIAQLATEVFESSEKVRKRQCNLLREPRIRLREMRRLCPADWGRTRQGSVYFGRGKFDAATTICRQQ